MFKESNKIADVEITEAVSSEAFDIPLDEKVIGSFSRDELFDFISNLPPLQRDVMELKVVDGLSISEIAQKLSVSENVVRQRLFQARKAITKFIESGYNFNE